MAVTEFAPAEYESEREVRHAEVPPVQTAKWLWGSEGG